FTMSMQDYQAAKSLIENNDGDFSGPKPEGIVVSAEQALNLTFPPSYRHFLLDLGCGSIGGLEIYGVIDEEFEDSGVPDGIWLTLKMREGAGLNPAYILIGDVG